MNNIDFGTLLIGIFFLVLLIVQVFNKRAFFYPGFLFPKKEENKLEYRFSISVQVISVIVILYFAFNGPIFW